MRDANPGGTRADGTADRELHRRFQAGDDAAVRTVYERHGGPMFAVALAVLRDRDLAADCVQQAFVQAWRASASFDPDRPLQPWLGTITRRVAIDLLRREARHRSADAADAPEPAVEGGSFEGAWETWELRHALDRLPAEEREVVRLSHLEELSHTEIATRLGVPVGTVKSRSHRAHRHLAERLGHLRQATS